VTPSSIGEVLLHRMMYHQRLFFFCFYIHYTLPQNWQASNLQIFC